MIFIIECVKIHYKYNKFDKICVVLSRFYGGQTEDKLNQQIFVVLTAAALIAIEFSLVRYIRGTTSVKTPVDLLKYCFMYALVAFAPLSAFATLFLANFAEISFVLKNSLTQEFQDFCRALLQLTLGTQSVFVAAKLLLGYLLLLFVGSSLATAILCFYSRWYKIRKQQTSESLAVKKVVFNYQNPVCNKLYLSLERLLN